MVAYAYIRASTTDQQDTLVAQKDNIKMYCKIKNIELHDENIFTDSGVSGSIDIAERPEGGKLLSKIRKGDIFIVIKIDRMSRNTSDFVNTLNMFNKNRIIFHCLEPSIDTSSSFGIFIAQLFSSLGELERAMAIDRVKATIKKRKENNECVGSIPYGYEKTKDKKLIPYAKEQVVVNIILDLYKTGLNMKKIAEKLNEDGIKNRINKFYPENIKRILVKQGVLSVDTI
jgi:DNA invertase Pin-like site-specific DNA recombinase